MSDFDDFDDADEDPPLICPSTDQPCTNPEVDWDCEDFGCWRHHRGPWP